MVAVLIVDDSAVARQQLRLLLQSDREIIVIGEAGNGEEAIKLTKRFRPDLITMDLRMPKMDGLHAIQHIMAECPTPVVVVTNVNPEREADVHAKALLYGAVSVLESPHWHQGSNLEGCAREIVNRVKLMSQVRVIRRPLPRSAVTEKTISDTPNHGAQITQNLNQHRISLIAIGSSTGGPAALHTILTGLPTDFQVPLVIAQHISSGFVGGLANWLDGASPIKVRVAKPDELLKPGFAFFAPDNCHLVVDRYGRFRKNIAGPVNGHRPSINVLFESVAQTFGASAMGVILTGMGSDGATGLKMLKDTGAITLAQDEASCVVFGMPKEAIGLDAVRKIVPLGEMAHTLESIVTKE